jgi:plasmid maintenance system killer protein
MMPLTAGGGPADLLRPDHAAGLKHLNVLDDSGQRHRQRFAQLSIRINRQWRICFRWWDAGPEDVEIVDYH